MAIEVTYLSELSWLSFLLLLGVILSFLASKLKISDLLLLLLTGLLVGELTHLTFTQSFLTSLSVFALIMIIFDSASKFKPKEFYQLSPPAIKLSFVFLLLSLILLSLLTHMLFSPDVSSLKLLVLSGIFGAMMSGTSPDVILSLMKGTTQKVAKIIEVESIINTPLAVLLPFIFLDFYFGTIEANVLLVTFLQGIMTGVGTGVVVALIVFSVMQRRFQPLLSPLVVIASALVSYVLAENIGGNGVLSVTGFALIFGAFTLKEKAHIEEFSAIFTNFLKIVVFLLIGLVIKVPWTDRAFLLKSALLFLGYLIIRYLAVKIAFYKADLTEKEALFMSLNVAKGVAIAVMIFILSAYSIEGLKEIQVLSLLFVLYSILLSTIVVYFQGYFLSNRKNVLKKKGSPA